MSSVNAAALRRLAELEEIGTVRITLIRSAEEIEQLRDLLGEVANGERPEMGWDDWQYRVKVALGR